MTLSTEPRKRGRPKKVVEAQKEDPDYTRIKNQYKNFFDAIDAFLSEHPEATLDYDGIMENKPYLAFTYHVNGLKICTEFAIEVGE